MKNVRKFGEFLNESVNESKAGYTVLGYEGPQLFYDSREHSVKLNDLKAAQKHQDKVAADQMRHRKNDNYWYKILDPNDEMAALSPVKESINESEELNEGLRQAGKELLDLKAMLNDEDSEILAAIYKQDGKKDRILTDQISKLYKKLRALSDKGYNLINMNESKEYQDSIDATDDMETIASLLNKHELMNWAKQTDLNYSVSAVRALKAAQKAYDKFYEEMLKAE